MTEIAFHVHVPDKLAYSCRLLRKAYLSGAKITVTGEPGLLSELDQLLWRFSAAEFLPHCHAGAARGPLAATPILLAESLAASYLAFVLEPMSLTHAGKELLGLTTLLEPLEPPGGLIPLLRHRPLRRLPARSVRRLPPSA